MTELVVATLLWEPNAKSLRFSQCYDEAWVRRLFNGFSRNLSIDFRKVLYTDRQRDLPADIEQVVISGLGQGGYADCIRPYELNQPMILCGLDTVVTGNVDHLAEYVLAGGQYALPRDPYTPSQACNGVALAPAGMARIAAEHDGANDMVHVRRYPHVFIDDLWPGQVVSYKGHVELHGIGDARIVYFHGDRKPHQLDDDWIAKHWRHAKTALCLGGADGVEKEWKAALALGSLDYVVACNDVGAIWPGRLDVWVTLHPEKMAGWREQRRANGHPDAKRYLVHGDYVPDWAELVEFRFPGQGDSGSSGLFTAKAALIDLGADRAVLAGIPLVRSSHFFDAAQWEAAGGYREVWERLRPEYRARIRSMSGWTAHFFGTPTTEWLATGSTDADVPASTLESTRMSKVKLDKIAYEPHPVSLERKRELNSKGFKIVDVRFAPAGAKPALDDGDGYGSDDELRAAIESLTGKAPHHKTGRPKLIEAFDAAKDARMNETASNGLTRREIEADLEGEGIEFDPRDSVEDLLALRDMAREERGA